MAHSKISIVVPIFNEEENIEELYKRIKEGLGHGFADFEYEIIFTDDGSNDQSFEILKKLHEKDKNVKVIQFSRNFGQHIAIKAGLDMASGDYTVLMDADLQDDPHNMSKLYEKLKEGYNIVMGVRENRQDSFLKKLFSRWFFRVMNRMANINMVPNQTMLRIFDKKVRRTLQNMPELHQNNGAFLAWIGFKQATYPLPHKQRFKGKTKYNFWRSMHFAVGTIMNFSNKPLIYISGLGMIISGLSIVYALYIIYLKVFHDIGFAGWASMMSLLAFVGGMILFALGIVGLYVGRIYQQSLQRPLYIIQNKLGDSS